MANRDSPEKYNLYYPSYLDWRRKVWVLQKGEVLASDFGKYRVREVVRSFVPGATPQVVLEDLLTDQTSNQSVIEDRFPAS